MKLLLLRLLKLFKLSLVTILIFTFSKQSFAQTKTFFEGSNIGVAVGKTKFNTRFSAHPNLDNVEWFTSDKEDLNNTILTGSINVGYSWIFNQTYLLGLETEIFNGSSKTLRNSNDTYFNSKLDYITNLRLKVGTIYEDKSLLYLTAGPATIKAKYNYFLGGYYGEGDNYPISINKTLYGLSYGAGVERQIDDKGSIKLEYMLTDLNSTSKAYPKNGDGTGCWYSDCRGPSWKTKFSSIRIGYNYHF